MFKRENRLAAGVRFKDSVDFSSPQFVLKVKRNRLMRNRLGIVVSKKIDKRAVIRNKIKRIFRLSLVDLGRNMASGHDILFLVRQGIIKKTSGEIRTLIKESLKKTGFTKVGE